MASPTCDVAIDLGTDTTRVFLPQRDILVTQASLVATNVEGRVTAIGDEARILVGRSPIGTKLVRPVQHGVVVDYRAAEALLRHVLRQARRRWVIGRPHVAIGIPTAATSTERRAIIETLMSAGAAEVRVVSRPLAAAVGAGLPVGEPVGSMVVDMGAGTTEAAVLSCGATVSTTCLPTGGDDVDAAIRQYLRATHGVELGEGVLHRLKVALLSTSSTAERIVVAGRQRATGGVERVEIRRPDLAAAIHEPIRHVTDAVRATLEAAPPDLVTDLLDRAIVLTGGGALLSGLAPMLAAYTGLAVFSAEDPFTAQVRGTGSLTSRPRPIARRPVPALRVPVTEQPAAP